MVTASKLNIKLRAYLTKFSSLTIVLILSIILDLFKISSLSHLERIPVKLLLTLYFPDSQPESRGILAINRIPFSFTFSNKLII